jgi:hypothetical protein
MFLKSAPKRRKHSKPRRTNSKCVAFTDDTRTR